MQAPAPAAAARTACEDTPALGVGGLSVSASPLGTPELRRLQGMPAWTWGALHRSSDLGPQTPSGRGWGPRGPPTSPAQCPQCQVIENRQLLTKLIFTLQMGAGTGCFLRLASGSPVGWTLRRHSGRWADAPRTAASRVRQCPRDGDSMFQGAIPRSIALLAHLQGGGL